jgi:RimJ/RimL family protein N-acetyltransferase
MKHILETERLILREFNFNDAQFIIELLNSEGWIKFIGDRNVKTEEDAIKYLQNGPIKSYRENDFGLSMVEKKDDKKSIGMCGIILRDELEIPDIGFAFLPEFMGYGYAFEIADATMLFARNKLKIHKISAITVAENSKSIRLIQKIGLNYIKTFCFPNKDEDLLLFSN